MKQEKLKAILAVRRVAQNELAARVGIDKSDFSRFLNGFKVLPDRFLVPLARELEIPTRDLMKMIKEQE